MHCKVVFLLTWRLEIASVTWSKAEWKTMAVDLVKNMFSLQPFNIINIITRNSAIADKPRDALLQR